MNSNTNTLTDTTTTVVTTPVMSPDVAPVGASTAPGASSNLGGISRIPAMYSLGMIASTLEDFNGKGVGRYLEKLEQRARLDGWSEEETLKLLKYKCVGEAYDFLRSDSSLDGLNFRALKAKLIANFSISRLPGERQFNLSRCYQRHDESVSSFCTRLRILGAQVLEDDLSSASNEEQAGIRKQNRNLVLNQFKIGLRREVMKEVGVLLLREDKLTLDKAEELVKLQETTMKMLQGRNSAPRVLHVNCYTCGKPGHISRECRSQPSTQKQGERNGCYVCNQQGHWARECPNRGVENRRSGNALTQGRERTMDGGARYNGQSTREPNAGWADRNNFHHKEGGRSNGNFAGRGGRASYGRQNGRGGQDSHQQDVRPRTDYGRQEERRELQQEARGGRPSHGTSDRNTGAIPKTSSNETNRVVHRGVESTEKMPSTSSLNY